MKIKLSKHQAKDVNLEANYDLIRAAFYLGYGIMMIKDFVTAPRDEANIADIIRTAGHLGMTDDDTVEVRDA